jgi:predicted N-acetyltransferase YhbS
MQVRSMTPADAAAVASLCGELGYPTTPEQARARLAAAHPDRDFMAVAEDDGQVVGCIHVAVRTGLDIDPRPEITALVVTGTRRSHGTGAALVAAGEAWAIARGQSVIRVRSQVHRADAHRFYERLGYRVSKTQKVFDKPLAAP